MKTGVLKPGRSTGPWINSNVDPVCGKRLMERDPQRSSEVDGQLVFFCSRECRRRFETEPDQYAAPLRRPD